MLKVDLQWALLSLAFLRVWAFCIASASGRGFFVNAFTGDLF